VKRAIPLKLEELGKLIPAKKAVDGSMVKAILR